MVSMKNEWGFEKREREKTRKLLLLRFSLSAVLAVVGLLVLSSQLLPLTGSFIQGRLFETQSASIAKPLPESYKQYIQGEFAYYDPGQTYFLNLSRQAQQQAEKIEGVTIDTEYSKDMFINIGSVGIENVKVTSNVESYDENVYNMYLKDGVAHFRGTPLPGDGGNSFIYGHSAITSFFQSNPDLPETIFTRLEDVDIGDSVEILKDGEVLTYTVRRKHVAEPKDFSVLNPSGHRETITLMTCWPIGIGSKRLILVAQLNES